MIGHLLKQKTNRHLMYLIIILAAGFILRVWGINFGLPFQFHQDEPMVVNHALAYGTGDLNPHYFQQPSFLSYILFLIYCVFFLVGKLAGMFASVDSFAFSFLKDPSWFYILGRFFLGAIPGTANIALTYVLCKTAFKGRGALISSLVMSLAFLNIINSHYIYYDTLLTSFILITYIYLFRLYDNPSLKNYIYSSIFLGIAVGVKYNAALMILPCLLTHSFIITREKKGYLRVVFSRNICVCYLVTVLAFLSVNPFILLSFKEFWQSFSRQVGVEWYMGWIYHLEYSIREGVSLPILAAGLAGLILMAIKEGRRALIFLSFPIIFYLTLVFFTQPFSRYGLPLIPFLAIAFGYFLFNALEFYRKRPVMKAAVVFFSILLFLPVAAKSIRADNLFCSKDTRVTSADWIRDNLPPGSKIACDSTFFRPALKQSYSQIRDKKNILKKQSALSNAKQKKFDYMLRLAAEEASGYFLYFLSENPDLQGQFLNTCPSIAFEVNDMKKYKVDYVVINYSVTNEIKEDFMIRLKKEAFLVKSFSPYYSNEIRMSYDTFATTCLPIRSRELRARKYAGPALEIYRLRK